MQNNIFWRLLTAVLCLTAGLAHGQIGIGLVVEGQVNVISGKPECGLRYGLDIEESDTVRTGEKSWAVLSLLDGAKIIVRPATELRIDAYRFVAGGNATLNRARLTLVRGAVRIRTGAITRSANTGYQINTTEMSMTLSGADYDVSRIVPQFTSGGEVAAGSYGKIYEGEAVMRNASGERVLRGGQAAVATLNARTPPRLLTQEPWFFGLHAAIDRRATAVAESLSGPNAP